MNGEYFRITLLVMFMSFLGTIYLEPSLSSFHFAELFVIIIGLVFAFLVLYGIATGKRWAWPAALIFFSLALINTSLIWAYYRLSTALVGTYFFEAAGWLLAIANLDIYDLQEDAKKVDISPPKAKAETYENQAREPKSGVEPEIIKDKDYQIRKTKNVFEPGKYIASSKGSKFHIPRCDWAAKIKPKRRVWFNDEREAKKKGYKACDCVK